ncbi:YoaK family protein [Microbacterium sp. LWH3-1.2]|uniref:YoaK family protein n=1 Tax=Microbacterium sp. LWH3-1.2 TaxID=3135256 RepID=UPI0034338EFA
MRAMWGRQEPERVELWCMLALTFSTGVIDAAGYLGLDRVFTGNMTGNVVILGMGLAGADDLPVLGPIVALIAFIAGAAVAGRAGRGTTSGWSGRTSLLLLLVTIALLVAAGLGAARESIDVIDHNVLTALLGLAMGVQAGAARAVGAKDVTTVVVTSTLVGLVYDSRLAGGNGGSPWPRRLLSVVLIGLGAWSGAHLVDIHFSWSVLLAAVVTAIVVIAGEVHRRARAA